MTGSRLRLLFFVREPFPTDRVDVDVLFGRKLLERGHRIDFVMQALDRSVATGAQSWRNTTVFVGRTDPANGFLHRAWKHILSLYHDLKCLRLANSRDYQAIQVRDKFAIAVVAAWVARRRNLQFFYWLSWPEAESQLSRARDRTARYPFVALMRGYLYDWMLYSWILPRADLVFAQSERMKCDVAARGVAPEKITAVPMGVELRDFPPNSHEPRPTADRQIVVGYLGVISAERRLGLLIDVIVELHQQGIAARLLVVGDAKVPADRIAIEERARANGVADRLEITGFLPRMAALERISHADVCLSPFFPTPILLSTSPTKLVEYLALGIPVVANDHPEQRLVLSQSRAGLCVPWKARHFARAIRWIARLSPQERRDMGRRGRLWVEARRTYDRLATTVEAAYRAQLEPPLNPPG